MAAAVLEKKVKGSMNGLDFYACEATLSATETTAVTIATGLRSIVNVQVTMATDVTAGENGVVSASVSGGTVTLTGAAALTGTTKVWVLVLGYRG